MGISPNHDSVIRLAGAALPGQHDKWTEQRRYLGPDDLTRARLVGEPTADPEEIPEPDGRALTAQPDKGSQENRYTTQKDLTSAVEILCTSSRSTGRLNVRMLTKPNSFVASLHRRVNYYTDRPVSPL